MVIFCITKYHAVNLDSALGSVIYKSSFVGVSSLLNPRGQLEKPVPVQRQRPIHFRFFSACKRFHETVVFNLMLLTQDLPLRLIMPLYKNRPEALSGSIAAFL